MFLQVQTLWQKKIQKLFTTLRIIVESLLIKSIATSYSYYNLLGWKMADNIQGTYLFCGSCTEENVLFLSKQLLAYKLYCSPKVMQMHQVNQTHMYKNLIQQLEERFLSSKKILPRRFLLRRLFWEYSFEKIVARRFFRKHSFDPRRYLSSEKISF